MTRSFKQGKIKLNQGNIKPQHVHALKSLLKRVGKIPLEKELFLSAHRALKIAVNENCNFPAWVSADSVPLW